MKNFYSLLVISFLMVQNIFAQEEAFSKSSLSLGNLLYDVNFISSQSGWAVGAGGTIMHTNDGGINWTMQLSGTTNRLWGVSFTDENNGIVVGWEGTILKTIDGGLNWTLQQSGTTEDLLGVFFTNANNGIAIGFNGKILRTTNGGINWQSQSNGVHWYSIYFTNSNNGILVGSDARILKTTDGGITWASQILGSFEWFFDVSFADANNGIVVGSNGTIMKTTDGGTSWRTSQSGVEYDLSGVFYIDSNNAVSVGENGIILQTTDGGVTWNSQKSPAIVKLFDVAFTDLNNGIIVGDYGLILKTTNGGKIWTAQMNTKEAPVLFSPANDAFDLGLDTVLLWSDLILKADNYHLQLSTDSSFNTLIYNDSTIINNNLEVNKLADSTLYYWRVRGKINDEYGDWSSTWQFRTLAKTARLFSPLNNSTISPVNVTLQWSPTAQTIDYKIQVSTDSLFVTNFIDQDNIVGLSAVINVSYGTKYFWHVGAKNIDGNIYWSNYSQFFTKPPPTTSFPLNIGNKWYYKAGSSRDYYYYAVVKEITDTLSNGFKEVTSTYYYDDSTTNNKEYWAYIDGKFSIGDLSTVYFNDYFTHDTCSATGIVEICWHLLPYQIFGTVNTAQVYSNWTRMHGNAAGDEITIFPGIGPIKTWHYSYFTSVTRDSIYLVGSYLSGEVLGDTTLSPPRVFEGDNWVLQNSGTTNDLNAVSFIDRYTGTAVGNNGTILRTTNGGQKWIVQVSRLKSKLNSVFFIDANNGWIVANDDTMITTTDGGTSWVSQETGNIHYLYDISFIDLNTGIAVGSSGWMIYTSNGGTIWNSQYIENYPNLLAIDFRNLDNATAVSWNGSIYNTSNSGMTWNQQSVGTSTSLNDIFYIDQNDGIIVGGGGTILRTIDGGANWFTQLSGTDKFLKAVALTDSNNGIVVGSRGTILRTLNGGSDWIPQLSGTINDLNDVAFTDAKNGWIVGSGGLILHTTSTTEIVSQSIFPIEFQLGQNYPNPFNPLTKIQYSIVGVQKVSLKVYDVLGNEVATLVNEEKQPGSYEVEFQSVRLGRSNQQLASGIYFYQLRAGDFVQTKKMILIK